MRNYIGHIYACIYIEIIQENNPGSLALFIQLLTESHPGVNSLCTSSLSYIMSMKDRFTYPYSFTDEEIVSKR